MNSLFKNIVAVFLSFLIIAGNGGISIFAHTCNQHLHTFYYIQDDDADCDHRMSIEKVCCKDAAKCHDTSQCCDTKTIVLKFDEHTFSYNTEKQISFNSDLFLIQTEWPLLLSEDFDQAYFTNDTYREEIIPLLNQKKFLNYYTSNKVSSEPHLS